MKIEYNSIEYKREGEDITIIIKSPKEGTPTCMDTVEHIISNIKKMSNEKLKRIVFRGVWDNKINDILSILKELTLKNIIVGIEVQMKMTDFLSKIGTETKSKIKINGEIKDDHELEVMGAMILDYYCPFEYYITSHNENMVYLMKEGEDENKVN